MLQTLLPEVSSSLWWQMAPMAPHCDSCLSLAGGVHPQLPAWTITFLPYEMTLESPSISNARASACPSSSPLHNIFRCREPCGSLPPASCNMPLLGFPRFTRTQIIPGSSHGREPDASSGPSPFPLNFSSSRAYSEIVTVFSSHKAARGGPSPANNSLSASLSRSLSAQPAWLSIPSRPCSLSKERQSSSENAEEERCSINSLLFPKGSI